MHVCLSMCDLELLVDTRQIQLRKITKLFLQSSHFSDEHFLWVSLKIAYLATKWHKLACNATFHLNSIDASYHVLLEISLWFELLKIVENNQNLIAM